MKWGMIVILLVIVTSTLISVNSQPEMDNIFGNEDEIEVIVVLKDDYAVLEGYGASNTIMSESATRKMMVQKQQKKVLNELKIKKKGAKEVASDYDFELRHAYSTVNGFSGKLKKSSYEKLKDDPRVLTIVKNNVRVFSLADSVPLVNATETWRLTYSNTNLTGLGETICVVDSGIDYTHQSLGGCTEASFLAGNCSKVLGGYDYRNNDNNPFDDQGHGTHVSGIIASTNGTFRGVAPDANLIAMKVCDNSSAGSCQDDDIIAGIEWCVNNATLYNISVISMSLGSTTVYSSSCDTQPVEAAFKIAVDNAAANNISVIAASGNSGSTTGMSSPACLANVTSVGSTTKTDAISAFSNRNGLTDLFAPGSSITSTVPTGGCVNCNPSGLASLFGTSMATPHVSAAFALLHQFKQLEDNKLLLPNEIQAALSSTGAQIVDTGGSGFTFPRINIMAAVLSLDVTAPIITNIYPANNSIIKANQTFLNISTNEVSTCSYNSTTCLLNESLNCVDISRRNFQSTGALLSYEPLNLTDISAYNLNIFCTDQANNQNSEFLSFNVSYTNKSNILPSVTSVTLTSADGSGKNITTDNLTVSWTFFDADNDAIMGNETFWYKNNGIIPSALNQTVLGFGNTSKGENWTLSVRIFDGRNWSDFVNSSILTILNSQPVLNISADIITVLETKSVNFTVSAADADNDTLAFSSNFSFLSYLNNTFNWTTNLSSSGTYVVNVTVNDSSSIDSDLIVIHILDARDLDDDGIPDFEDDDDDNDGIPDEDDFLTGDLSKINSSINLNFTINGSSNISKLFNGTALINITFNNKTILEFNFTFSPLSRLDLENLTINKKTNGSSAIAIRGKFNLFSFTKTIFLDKVDLKVKSVCVKDDDVGFESISIACDSANETLVICNNAEFGPYRCTDLGSEYKITGLSHSAVQEQCRDNDGDGYGAGCAVGNDCDDSDSSKTTDCSSSSSSSSGGGSGGGGGGGGGSGAFFICNQEWECGDWSECDGSWQTRECELVKVPQHTSQSACDSLSYPPAASKECTIKRFQAVEETCNDRIKNQNETGVDCGGACEPCKRETQPVNIAPTPQSNQITGLAINDILGENLVNLTALFGIISIIAVSIVVFKVYKK